MAKTNFGKITKDLEKAQSKKSFEKTDKADWLKIAYGDNIFMVLPPINDDSDLFHEVTLHFGFVDSDGNNRVYLCSKVNHKACPICDRYWTIKDKLPDEAKNIKPQKTYLYNVMDLDKKNRVVGLKPSQHKELLLEINTCYQDEELDITDPANGISVKLTRLKADPWARCRRVNKSISLSEEAIEELLKGCKDLTKLYVDNTPEELERMMSGEDINKKTDKEVVETPKKQAKVEDDDDFRDDPPPPKPAPKREAVPRQPIVEEPVVRTQVKKSVPAEVKVPEEDDELAEIEAMLKS